jgi:hypothetical protein
MRALLPAVLLLLPLLAACSRQLEGRVVRGDMSLVQWVGAEGAAFGDGEPVAGATITVTRDPQSPGRQIVGRGVSRDDGSFAVELEAFAAGWTAENFLIVVQRSGAGRAEFIGPLEQGSLLAILAAGSDRGSNVNDYWEGNIGRGESRETIMDEVKRFDGRAR